MFKTLGIFGFVIVILLILMLVYFVLKWTTNAVRSKKVGLLVKTLAKIKDAISQKLFYNSFLRYMIVSNLKLTYTVFGFFILTTSKIFSVSKDPNTEKVTLSDKITLAVICFAILFLLAYPIMTMLFLIHN